MKNIFEFLKENKVCYSVCVSESSLRLGAIISSSNYVDRDYFIIASSLEDCLKDTKIEGRKNTNKYLMGFVKNEPQSRIIERTLNEDEILIFKTMQDSFTKVIHNSEGRVYELKNNSFKQLYKTVKW